MKTITPSPSYLVTLPDAIREEYDGRVGSFWVDGEPLLLQLSSYLRTDGQPITAQGRLQQRIEQHPGSWKVWLERVHPDASVDQVTAESLDENLVLWVHVYLVWSHLTVYASISGPESRVREPSNWARQAVESIALAVH